MAFWDNEVMRCINCNKEISDSMKFCNYCGTKQPANRAEWQRLNPREDEKAEQKSQHEASSQSSNGGSTLASGKLLIKCPKCGQVVSRRAPFCPRCGQPIAKPVAKSAAQNASKPATSSQETPHQDSKDITSGSVVAQDTGKLKLIAILAGIVALIAVIALVVIMARSCSKGNESYNPSRTDSILPVTEKVETPIPEKDNTIGEPSDKQTQGKENAEDAAQDLHNAVRQAAKTSQQHERQSQGQQSPQPQDKPTISLPKPAPKPQPQPSPKVQQPSPQATAPKAPAKPSRPQSNSKVTSRKNVEGNSER